MYMFCKLQLAHEFTFRMCDGINMKIQYYKQKRGLAKSKKYLQDKGKTYSSKENNCSYIVFCPCQSWLLLKFKLSMNEKNFLRMLKAS